MQADQLDDFIRDMLKSKQLAPIPEDVQTQLIDDLRVRMLDQVDRAVLAAMNDNQASQLDEMLDRGATDGDVQAYIASSVPNVAEITAQTLLRFREAYLR